MTSTADQFWTTTTSAIITSTPPITRSNNIHALSTVDDGPVSSYFGVYQQITVASGDVSIRTLVPAAISTAPDHNVLIVKRFFHQILALADTPSVSFSHLTTTVAMFFSLNTGAAEREMEAAVAFIRYGFFVFINCRALVSLTLLWKQLRSRTRITSLQILLIYVPFCS